MFQLLKMDDYSEISPHEANLQVFWTKLVAVHVNG